MTNTTPRALDAGIIARVPAAGVGTGVIPAPGARIMLRAGDRFAARWLAEEEVGLCCEVLSKRGKKYDCRILNGMWGLTFDERGLAKHNDRTAAIVMLLPKKLTNVADMDNWDRVLAVVEQQLRKASPKRKPAGPSLPEALPAESPTGAV